MKFKSKQYLAFIALVQFLGVSAEAQYEPSPFPTYSVTPMPSYAPTSMPTYEPPPMPSYEPSAYPTYVPPPMPSYEPSTMPTYIFTVAPEPTVVATEPDNNCNLNFAPPIQRGEGTFADPIFSEWYSNDGTAKTVFRGADEITDKTVDINGTVTSTDGSRSEWEYEEYTCVNRRWLMMQRLVHKDQNELVIKITAATKEFKSDYFTEIDEQTIRPQEPLPNTTFYYYKLRKGVYRKRFGDNGDKNENTYRYTTESTEGSASARKEEGHMLKTQTRDGNCIGVKTDRDNGADQPPYNAPCTEPMPE